MRRTVFVLLALLGGLVLIEAGFSLAWPIAHDEAPLFYEALLMHTQGRLPYRDLFDFQMPGTYAAFYSLGLLSDFDPLRIRILDLMLLAALLALTFLWMRGFGWQPAVAAATLFGLKYLEGGPSMALQREFLLLIPLALGLWLYMRDESLFSHRLLIGACFGLAALLKPHAAIGLLPVLILPARGSNMSREGPAATAAIRTLAILGGFLIPVATVFVWMWATGMLAPFLEIALNYWPLYSQINGQLVVTTGAARWGLILDQVWRLGGNAVWLLPAVVGAYVTRNEARQGQSAHRNVLLLIWLAASYALYPAFSGQFFQYHYLPFMYFGIALSSLCLGGLRDLKRRAGALALLLAAILVSVRIPAVMFAQLEGKSLIEGRAEQIAAYLANHLEQGDTVQPLDWTGGALQAMLATRAHLATSFVFDFYFYHHVSDPYIQGLRARFMEELRSEPPTYVVEVTMMDKPWVAGPDTSREFPELRQFLAERYTVAVTRGDYLIYRRK